MLQKPVHDKDEALCFRFHLAQTVAIIGKRLHFRLHSSRLQSLVQLHPLRRRNSQVLHSEQDESRTNDFMRVRNGRSRDEIVVLRRRGHDAGRVSGVAGSDALDEGPIGNVGDAEHVGEIDDGVTADGDFVEGRILTDEMSREKAAVRSAEHNHFG